MSALVDEGTYVQLDKSQYSTVGRSSCLVHVQWMKNQSRTVNSLLFKCMYSSCACKVLVHRYMCLVCVCVCLGGGGVGGGDLRQPSPVICKSHEL